MKRILIPFVAVLSLLFVSNANANAFPSHFPRYDSYYIGLWQGIDPVDGSEVLIAISRNDNDTVSVLGHESSFYVCHDTDQGVITGTAQFQHGRLVGSQTVQCSQAVGGESVGPYPVEYVPDKTHQILIIKYTSPTSDSAPIILYRISQK